MTTKPADISPADAAYAKGRFVEAEDLYRSVLITDPSNARALEQLGLIALWKNDLATAETNLNAALDNKSWLGRQWPLDVQTNTRLAILNARGGRIREAAALLDKAAGPLSFGPLKELRARARQLALFDPENRYFQIEGPAETIVPFVIIDPLPVVKVSINGSSPVNFFIDTGGEGIILDTDYAKEVGAIIASEVPGEYAAGKTATTGIGKVDKVSLGDILISNVAVSCLDLQPISKTSFGETEIKGIVGTGFLMQFLSTIDYRNEQLILRHPADTIEKTNELLGVTEQDHIFPIWLVETHLIFSIGSVNDLSTRLMLIDTGLGNAGFLASKKISADAGIGMDWSKAGEGAGGGGMVKGLSVSVDRVTLGSGVNALQKNNIRGVVFEEEMSIFNGSLGFNIGGLISHEFFRDSALSFDFVNMRMIVQD